MTECIEYRAGYKYQLHRTYSLMVPVTGYTVDEDFLWLSLEGLLTIVRGYAWDGPSGPTFDTKTFMRGSLVHDALYQLMRERFIPRSYRDAADRILMEICKEDLMLEFRANYVYWSVRKFANPATDPAKERPVLYAPKRCLAPA